MIVVECDIRSFRLTAGPNVDERMTDHGPFETRTTDEGKAPFPPSPLVFPLPLRLIQYVPTSPSPLPPFFFPTPPPPPSRPGYRLVWLLSPSALTLVSPRHGDTLRVEPPPLPQPSPPVPFSSSGPFTMLWPFACPDNTATPGGGLSPPPFTLANPQPIFFFLLSLLPPPPNKETQKHGRGGIGGG